MNAIVIAGGTGLVGKRLGAHLAAAGYRLVVLTRHPERYLTAQPYPARFVRWDSPELTDAIQGCQGVINLCGEGIMDQPWTGQRRQELLNSRTQPTTDLARIFETAGVVPPVWIQASAIGVYGTAPREICDEQALEGDGFLSDLCQQWETCARKHVNPKTRLVLLRIGLVFAEEGGFLGQMIDLYSIGLGARLGSGRQYLSGLSAEDLCRMIAWALDHDTVCGVINAVCPEPFTAADFHQKIRKSFSIQNPFPIPPPALRLFLGARSELVLADQRVVPGAAMRLGFRFEHPSLETMLRHCLPPVSFPPQGRVLRRQIALPRTVTQLWPFFCDARNLERLTPPWLGFRITAQSTPEIREGTEIHYALRLRGVPLRWRTRILDWVPGEQFVDTQESGPYALWHHSHMFTAVGEAGCVMTDRVVYRLPLHPVAWPSLGWWIGRDIAKIFDFRAQVIADLVARNAL